MTSVNFLDFGPPSPLSVPNPHNLPSFGQNLVNPPSPHSADVICEWPSGCVRCIEQVSIFSPSVTKTTTITTTTELTTAETTVGDSIKQLIEEEAYEREEHKYSAEEKPSPQPPLVRQDRRKSTSSSESFSEVSTG